MDLDINQSVDYQACSPDQLVNLLAFKAHYIGALRALVGGAFGRELQQLALTDKAFQALIRGLDHKNPNVRFQCVQLMVRIAAIAALGTLSGNSHVDQSLQSILATATDPKLRQAAQQSLSADKRSVGHPTYA
ncbi:hypothetical protein BH10CHL1_BH10CHL1_07290 [soil metagenome]